MFVKIDSKLLLLKDKGLAPSTRKSKPKKSPKSLISSTNLQYHPTNPPNPRRRSDNFVEKLIIFQHQEINQKSASNLHSHPSANSPEQKFKNR
jgi:hypothetical protein